MQKRNHTVTLLVSEEADRALRKLSKVYRRYHNLAVKIQEVNQDLAFGYSHTTYKSHEDIKSCEDFMKLISAFKTAKNGQNFTIKELVSYLQVIDSLEDFETSTISKWFLEPAAREAKRHFERYSKYKELHVSNSSCRVKYLSDKYNLPRFETSQRIKVVDGKVIIPGFEHPLKIAKRCLGIIPESKHLSNPQFLFDGIDWTFKAETSEDTSSNLELTGDPIFLDFNLQGDILINGRVAFERILSKSGSYKRKADHLSRTKERLKNISKYKGDSNKLLKELTKDIQTTAAKLLRARKLYFLQSAKRVRELLPREVNILNYSLIEEKRHGGKSWGQTDNFTYVHFKTILSGLAKMGVEIIEWDDYVRFGSYANRNKNVSGGLEDNGCS